MNENVLIQATIGHALTIVNDINKSNFSLQTHGFDYYSSDEMIEEYREKPLELRHTFK